MEIFRAAAAGGKKKDARQLPALVLAYIGDTVFDLYVRTALIGGVDAPVHALHLSSAKIVCAAGQTAAYHRIESMLTEEEQDAFRRGRNAHSGTVPKNQKVTDYRTATGLETLLGTLYWEGKSERITELMNIALEGVLPNGI